MNLRFLRTAVILALLMSVVSHAAENVLSDEEKQAGFVMLFDGKSLDGWKPNESPASFKVENGKIIASGPRSHLYYMGDVAAHNFKNFEFRAKVLIHPGSNSGIYFHAAWLDSGWPLAQGYEAQVCSNDYSDPRKTGSIYKYVDLKNSAVKDGEWFDYTITVIGNKITTKLNGTVAAEYTEPDDKKRLKGGTFAIQCHDPKSKVEYHTIRVKVLPDDAK